jgi:hypothetical protein
MYVLFQKWVNLRTTTAAAAAALSAPMCHVPMCMMMCMMCYTAMGVRKHVRGAAAGGGGGKGKKKKKD